MADILSAAPPGTTRQMSPRRAAVPNVAVGNAAGRIAAGEVLNPTGFEETAQRISELNATLGSADDAVVRERARTVVDTFDVFLNDFSQSKPFTDAVVSLIDRCVELGHTIRRGEESG